MSEEQKKQQKKTEQDKRREKLAKLAVMIADHQSRLQVIGANWGAIITGKLNASERALLTQLEKSLSRLDFLANDPDCLKRLEKICEKLKTIRHAAIAEAEKEILKEARELAEHESKWANRITSELSENKETAQKLKPTSAAKLDSVVDNGLANGKTAQEWFEGLEESDAARIETVVKDGVAQGKTINQIRKDIVGTAQNDHKDSALQVSRNTAVNMARTLSNAIANNAKQAYYEENDDIIIGVEILSTLDGRTCPACAALDRKRYKTHDKHPTPPIHHQCRCVLLPVTELSDLVEESRPMARADFMAEAKRNYEAKYPGKKFDDLSPSTKKKYYYQAMREYEERTGESAYVQVSGSVSFRDYFNEHMTEQQRKDWLGKKRYDIWKRGKLKLDKFIPPYPNKQLTVKELERLEGEIA